MLLAIGWLSACDIPWGMGGGHGVPGHLFLAKKSGQLGSLSVAQFGCWCSYDLLGVKWRCRVLWKSIHTWKINMEHNNGAFGRWFSFPNGWFFGSTKSCSTEESMFDESLKKLTLSARFPIEYPMSPPEALGVWGWASNLNFKNHAVC